MIFFILIVMLCAHGYAERASGVSDGIPWHVTDDWTLILGEGDVYTLSDRLNRGNGSWGWSKVNYSDADKILKVEIDGTIVGNGSLSQFFYGLKSCTSFDVSHLDVSNVLDLSRIFDVCVSVKQVDLSTWDTHSVHRGYINTYYIRGFSEFFGAGSNICSVILGDGFSYNGDGTVDSEYTLFSSRYYWRKEDMVNRMSFDSIYENGESLSFAGLWYNSETYAFYYENGDLVFQWGCTPEENRGNMLYRFQLFEDDDAYSSSSRVPWRNCVSSVRRVIVKDVISPCNTAYWFYFMTHCSVFDIDKLDMSHVSSVEHMFYNCSSLVSFVAPVWDFSSVTNLRYFLCGCDCLEYLDLSRIQFSVSVSTPRTYFFPNKVGVLREVVLPETFRFGTYSDSMLPSPPKS